MLVRAPVRILRGSQDILARVICDEGRRRLVLVFVVVIVVLSTVLICVVPRVVDGDRVRCSWLWAFRLLLSEQGCLRHG